MLKHAIKPIWLIMPNETLKKLAVEVISKNESFAHITNIYVADSVAAIPVAKFAIENGAKAIVSRGGTANLIRESNENFPVVDIEPNVPLVLVRYFDLKRIHPDKNIILFSSSSFRPDKHQLSDLEKRGYKVHLYEELFSELRVRVSESDIKISDLKDDFKELVKDGVDKCFILGDASACRIAQDHNIQYEEIESSENDVLVALEKALSFVRTAFVGMSLSTSEVQLCYEKAMIPVLTNYGFNVLSQIDNQTSGGIVHQIVNDINSASVVLVDVTGERPNCYYELGYAEAINKSVIITAKEGTSLHFDIAGDRCIYWNNWYELEAKLKYAIEALGY